VRVVVALALLTIAAGPARALEVCVAERDDASSTPAAAEDVRAYRACVERWRQVLPRAEAELAKPPPRRLAACDGPFARWQAAAAVAPDNYDAMLLRLAARDETERCVADALAPREPLAVVAGRIAAENERERREHERREGRGWVILGSVFLGTGGVGLTAAGATGLALDVGGRQANPLGGMVFGLAGALGGVLAGTGVLLVGFGARKLARNR